MNKRFINKKVIINASIEKVWRVFTDPVVTRQMGGEYASDWKVGSSFGWKGNDGKMYTNGILLELGNQKLIKHSLLDAVQKDRVVSIISYRFMDDGEQTVLEAREELNDEMNDQQYQDSLAGWEIALDWVKKTAESL